MNPNEQVDKMQQSVASPLPQSVVSSSRPMKKVLLSILGFVVLLLIAGGAYYAGTQQNKSKQFATTKITPTPTPAWQLYTYGNGFSLWYPSGWTTRENITVQGDVLFYDKGVTGIAPTGPVSQFPSEYLYIYKPGTGETAKEYADRITSGPQYTGRQTYRRSIMVKDLTGELFKDEGEGSRGYDLALSRGTNLLVITIPTANIESDPILDKMISGIEITTPVQDLFVGGGLYSFAKYNIPSAVGWMMGRNTTKSEDITTLSKGNYKLKISQGAFDGAVCSFPDNPVEPGGIVQMFTSFVKINGQNGTLYRRGQINGTSDQPGMLLYEVCAWNPKNGMYQEFTPFGRIDYTVPANPDPTVLSQMDSFVASLQEQK